MQKKLRSLFVIVSLFTAAAIVFIACGSGEMVSVGDSEKLQVIDGAETQLKNKIDDILDGYEPPPPSSNHEPEYSSAAPPQGGSSSSQGSQGGQSSSQGSQGGQSSSQGSQGGQSSSSAPQVSTTGCGNDAKPSGFTSCKWDNESPLPNKKITAQNTGCTVSQWYWKASTSSISPCNEFNGELNADGGKEYHLYADVNCSGTKASLTCGSIAKTATAPKLSGTCTWDSNPTAAAAGATASGVELDDPSKVCGTTKPPIKYYQESGTEWQQGKAVALGNYKVYATVDCPDYPSIGKVSCPELEVKDVMYQMKGSGDENAITIDGPAPINVAIKMSLPANWHNNETDGTCTFYCGVTRGSNGDGKLEGTVDGEKLSGGDHVTATIKITSTINDYSLPLKITTLGGSSIKCGINW